MNQLDMYMMGWAFELFIAAMVLAIIAIAVGGWYLVTCTGLRTKGKNSSQCEWYIGRMHVCWVASSGGTSVWKWDKLGRTRYLFLGSTHYFMFTWLLPDEARIQKAVYKHLLKGDSDDHSAL